MQSFRWKSAKRRFFSFILAVAMVVNGFSMPGYAKEYDEESNGLYAYTEEETTAETGAEETDAEDGDEEETPIEETGSEETPITEEPGEETPVEEGPSVENPVEEPTEEDGNEQGDMSVEAVENGTSGFLGSNVAWKLTLNDDLSSRTLVIFPIVENDLVPMESRDYSKDYPWYKYKNSIKKIVIENGITSIGREAFSECGAQEVEFADTVQVIEDYAFDKCLLNSIQLPSHLREVGKGAFRRNNLSEVIIPEGVKYLREEAFADMNLSKIAVSSSVELIGERCFKPLNRNVIQISVNPSNNYYCSDDNVLYTKDKKSLILCGKELTGTYQISDGVERIEDYAFCYKKSNVYSIVIADSVTYIGDYAFAYCDKIYEVQLSKNLIEMGNGVFRDDYALMNVTIPDSVEKIGGYCFSNTKLNKVTLSKKMDTIGRCLCAEIEVVDAVIPYGVKKIESYAFFHCSKLKSVTIPKSVTELECDAFHSCVYLSDIYYGGTKEEWIALIEDMQNVNWLSGINMHYFVGEASLHLADAALSGEKLKASVRFSELTFSCDNESIEKVVVGNWVNDTYGVNVAKSDLTQPRGNYWAYLTLVAKPGSTFTEGTHIFVDGRDCEVFDVSADGSRISLISPTYETECVHRRNGNLAWEWECNAESHWQVCSVCGETKGEGLHTYDAGTNSGGTLTQHCTTCNNEKVSSNGKTRITKARIMGGNYDLGSTIPQTLVMDPGYYYSSVLEVVDLEWYKGSISPSNKIDRSDYSAVFEDTTYTLKVKFALKNNYTSSYYLKSGGITLAFTGGGFKEDTSKRTVEVDPQNSGREIQTAVFSYTIPKKVGLDITIPDYYENITADAIKNNIVIKSGGTNCTPASSYMTVMDENRNVLEPTAILEKDTTYLISLIISDIPGYLDWNLLGGNISGYEPSEVFYYNEATKTTSLIMTAQFSFTAKTIMTATMTMDKPYVGDELGNRLMCKESDEFEVLSMQWYLVETPISSMTLVESGVEYNARIILKARKGYTFSFDDTIFTVNGLEPGVWGKDDGTYQIDYKFITVEEHVHEPVLVPAEMGNCTIPGHEQYYECKICGRYFFDEACEMRIRDLGIWLSTPGGDWYGGMIFNMDQHDFTVDGLEGDVAEKCKFCGKNNVNYWDLDYSLKTGRYTGLIVSLSDLFTIKGLTYGIDYIFEDGVDGCHEAILPGTYHTVVTGVSYDWVGRREIEWSIAADGMWITMEPSYEYTGTAIKPAVKVYEGDKLLTAGTDYTISYSNNTNAFTLKESDSGFAALRSKAPTVTVTGKGNYTGKEVAYFVIEPKSLENAEVEDITVSYTGKDIAVKPVVKCDGKTLKAGKDYMVYERYTSNMVNALSNEGMHYLTVVGVNNYKGQKFFDFNITSKALISKCSITVKNAEYDNGNVVKPVIEIKDKGVTLVENTHYRVELRNTEVGTAYVKITGMGQYAGCVTKKFTITGVPINSTKNTVIAPMEYSGLEIRPGMALTYEKKNEPMVTLVAGRDYELSYSNNVNVGVASVVITGKGRYTGSKTVKFNIKPYDMQKHNFLNVWVNGGSGIVESYKASGATPIPTITFNGKTLTLGKDYTLKYLNNKAVANSTDANPPTIQIQFKGNYSGTLAKNFTITKKSITDTNVDVNMASVIYSDKAGAYASKILLKGADGKALTLNKEYTVKYFKDSSHTQTFTDADNGVGETVYVLIEGCGENYTGTLSKSYKIWKGDLSKATVKVADKEYQNGRTKITKADITISCNGTTVPDSDYEIMDASYKAADKVGTAKVTIVGKNGNYFGQKEISYKITPFDVVKNTGNVISLGTSSTTAFYTKQGATIGVNVYFHSSHLVEGRDYSISYINNKKVANSTDNNPPTAVIKFKGNFKGEKKLTFNIKACPIQTVIVKDSDVVYNPNPGGFKAKKITIADMDGNVLKAGVDYENITTFYSNDTCTQEFTDADNVSGAFVYFKVNAKAGSNYSGSTLCYYRIIEADLSKATVSVNSMYWTGSAIQLSDADLKVSFGKNGVPLVKGVDYDIQTNSYKNNVERGTATVTIYGKGNYSGSKTISFKIVPKPVRWWHRF